MEKLSGTASTKDRRNNRNDFMFYEASACRGFIYVVFIKANYRLISYMADEQTSGRCKNKIQQKCMDNTQPENTLTEILF